MPNDSRDTLTPNWLAASTHEQHANDSIGWWITGGGASLLAWTGFVLLLTAA